MKHFKQLLSFILLIIAVPAVAQNNYTIEGKIFDEKNQPYDGASVDIFVDSNKMLFSIFSEADGAVLFDELESGSYKIVVSTFGYEDFTKQIVINGNNVNIGNITLKPVKKEDLAGITIQGDRLPVQQKDDTTQYDAGAFKTNPDATAEDLLRKMPGMDMSSGTPKTQGESVTKVLIDGKPFYGDDPTAALRNLPADVIDKIQVYDEKSEQSRFSGFDDGNTTKTINIQTRKDRKEGVFGKVYGGGGNDIAKDAAGDFRYNTGATVNYFKGNRRLSLMGTSNNVNQQNFGSQDLMGASSGGASGRGGMRGGPGGGGMRGGPGGSGGSTFGNGTQDGITSTNAIGLNYTDVWNDKVDVSASYFFNQSENNTIKSINRDFVLPNQFGQAYNETSNSNTKNSNHRFNARIDYNIDSSNRLLIMPTFFAQKNNSNSNSFGQTTLNNSFLNSTTNDYLSNNEALNAGLKMLYSHKFKKAGRTTSLWLDGSYTKNNSNNFFYADNQYLETILNDTLDQYSTNDKNGFSGRAHLSYTEPISKRSALQIRYKYSFNDNKSDKYTNNYNPLTGIPSGNEASYTIVDTNLSSVYASSYTTNGAELSYRFTEKKYDFNIGLEFQNALLTSDRTMPIAGNLNQNFNNILPSARFKYNFDKSKNLRIFYRSYSRNPSVDQLQDVINNSNPLQLTTGNANLDQSIQNDIFGMFSSANTKNSSTFFAMVRANLTQDYVGNSTTIAENDMYVGDIFLAKGTQLSRPVNIDGYKTFTGFATYGKLVSQIKTNINVNANLGYTVIPGLINEQRNDSKNSAMGLGLTLSSNISEKIDFTLTSNGTYNIINNSLNENSNNEYYNQISRFSFNYIFAKGFVFNTDMSHLYYTGLGGNNDQNVLLWNASIGKKFLKDNQAEIKLQAFDLLGQNSSVTPLITEAYRQVSRSNVLQRYFQLTFTWNLKYFKGNATAKDAEPKASPYGGYHGMM